ERPATTYPYFFIIIISLCSYSIQGSECRKLRQGKQGAGIGPVLISVCQVAEFSQQMTTSRLANLNRTR
ncbi:MAG: hypothetical protein ACI9X0_002061, partial [Kiritimatiellia bacterium]